MPRNTGLFALAVLALLAVTAPTEAAVHWPGHWPGSFRGPGISLFAIQNDPDCNGKATSCSGCSSVVHCANMGSGSWQKAYTSTCPAKTPYCDSAIGDCTATPPAVTDASCGAQIADETFACSADGYWPDLSSCTKFYLCVNDKAYAQSCEVFPGTVYDQRTTRCVPRSRVQCFTLNCNDFNANNNGPVVYKVYTPAPWIYAVCRSRDGSTPPLMSACSPGQVMNAATSSCEAACQKEGRFKPEAAADATVPVSTTAFYDCVDLGGGKLSKPLPNACPDGSTFDETQQQCITATVAPPP